MESEDQWKVKIFSARWASRAQGAQRREMILVAGVSSSCGTTKLIGVPCSQLEWS
jgi:hypothetical protein